MQGKRAKGEKRKKLKTRQRQNSSKYTKLHGEDQGPCWKRVTGLLPSFLATPTEGGQIKSISKIKTGHLPGRNTHILVLNPELWLLKVLIKAVMSDVLHIVTVNTQLMAVS